jgi:hypothetical protein
MARLQRLIPAAAFGVSLSVPHNSPPGSGEQIGAEEVRPRHALTPVSAVLAGCYRIRLVSGDGDASADALAQLTQRGQIQTFPFAIGAGSLSTALQEFRKVPAVNLVRF